MRERTFRLYDSMSRQVRPLQTLEPGHLKFYSCGPTVYSYAHIGNFRSFITADLIVRTARAIGWEVMWVSNITDVGHLTDDDVADSAGEDKMEKALRSKEGESFHNVWELAEHYEDAYLDDWKRLNLSEPDVRPRATQHVREQIIAAQELVAKGHAYITPSAVYFDVNSFPNYGRLSGNTQENLREGVREVVLDENKRSQADFAIWKTDDKHLMQWFSPYGWGFPGWHLECSVMARAYLGDTIDLHSGGEDNKFPHHECEIAQSEALTGKPFSNHWVHTKFLLVDGEKMSKSKGNFYTVRDLFDSGRDPLAIRLALISTAFTKELNFTMEGLTAAERNVRRMRDALEKARAATGEGEDTLGAEFEATYEEAVDAMCENLNTSVAVARALEGAKIVAGADHLSAASGKSAVAFFEKINALLGIVFPDYKVGAAPEPEKPAVDEARILGLIEERSAAKKAKDFARADQIRKDLDAEGIELQDTPQGTLWKLK